MSTPAERVLGRFDTTLGTDREAKLRGERDAALIRAEQERHARQRVEAELERAIRLVVRLSCELEQLGGSLVGPLIPGPGRGA